jgi:hypothetical protein
VIEGDVLNKVLTQPMARSQITDHQQYISYQRHSMALEVGGSPAQLVSPVSKPIVNVRAATLSAIFCFFGGHCEITHLRSTIPHGHPVL